MRLHQLTATNFMLMHKQPKDPARSQATRVRSLGEFGTAEVTLAQLRMPELTIADIEQAEADALKYRYE